MTTTSTIKNDFNAWCKMFEKWEAMKPMNRPGVKNVRSLMKEFGGKLNKKQKS